METYISLTRALQLSCCCIIIIHTYRLMVKGVFHIAGFSPKNIFKIVLLCDFKYNNFITFCSVEGPLVDTSPHFVLPGGAPLRALHVLFTRGVHEFSSISFKHGGTKGGGITLPSPPVITIQSVFITLE